MKFLKTREKKSKGNRKIRKYSEESIPENADFSGKSKENNDKSLPHVNPKISSDKCLSHKFDEINYNNDESQNISLDDDSEFNQNLKVLVRKLEIVTKKMKLLESISDNLSLNQHLNGIEYAAFNCTMAFLFTSFFFVYLKLNGQDGTNHPIHKEIERIRLSMQKVSAILEESDDKESKTMGKKMRKMIVDKDAAYRVVDFYTKKSKS